MGLGATSPKAVVKAKGKAGAKKKLEVVKALEKVAAMQSQPPTQDLHPGPGGGRQAPPDCGSEPKNV